MMFRKILCVWAAVVVCAGVAPVVGEAAVFAGGDGSEGNPYKVSTPEQMNEVRNYLDKCFVQVNNISMSSWGDWAPIGDYTEKFTGVYDGENYVITGLKIKIERTNYNNPIYAGLFGVNGGIIKNLGIADSDTSATDDEPTVITICLGFIAGVNDSNGIIRDCFNAGNIDISCSAAAPLVGGVCGDNYRGGKIINSYNAGKVFSLTGSFSKAFSGGVVGCNEGGHIENCYNTGGVSASSNVNSSAGGITGSNKNNNGGGSIYDCFNTGSVSSKSQNMNSGGIAGEMDSTSIINNCYNVGEISASNNSGATFSCNVGGITGFNDHGSIYNCCCLNLFDSLYGSVKTAPQMKDISFVNLLNANRGGEAWWSLDTASLNGGYPIFDYQLADVVEVKIDVVESDKDADVVVAFYGDNLKLLRFVKKQTKIPAGATTVPVAIGKSPPGTKSVKVFVWNSLMGMQPLGSCYE